MDLNAGRLTESISSEMTHGWMVYLDLWYSLAQYCQKTQQPPHSTTVKSCHISLFGHVHRMMPTEPYLSSWTGGGPGMIMYHLATNHYQWSDLSRSKGSNLEWTFLEIFTKQCYVSTVGYVHIGLDCSTTQYKHWLNLPWQERSNLPKYVQKPVYHYLLFSSIKSLVCWKFLSVFTAKWN